MPILENCIKHQEFSDNIRHLVLWGLIDEERIDTSKFHWIGSGNPSSKRHATFSVKFDESQNAREENHHSSDLWWLGKHYRDGQMWSHGIKHAVDMREWSSKKECTESTQCLRIVEIMRSRNNYHLNTTFADQQHKEVIILPHCAWMLVCMFLLCDCRENSTTALCWN
jgi:hypothetical protein